MYAENTLGYSLIQRRSAYPSSLFASSLIQFAPPPPRACLLPPPPSLPRALPPSTVASTNPAQLVRVPIPWLRPGQFHRSRDGPSPAVAGAKRVVGAGDPRQGRSGLDARALRESVSFGRFLSESLEWDTMGRWGMSCRHRWLPYCMTNRCRQPGSMKMYRSRSFQIDQGDKKVHQSRRCAFVPTTGWCRNMNSSSDL
nr:uncharacterized protein LOC109769180 isoform X1 [Aegilops tauschii subsp. strangulata]